MTARIDGFEVTLSEEACEGDEDARRLVLVIRLRLKDAPPGKPDGETATAEEGKLRDALRRR